MNAVHQVMLTQKQRGHGEELDPALRYPIHANIITVLMAVPCIVSQIRVKMGQVS